MEKFDENHGPSATVWAKVIAVQHMVSGVISIGLFVRGCVVLSNEVVELEQKYMNSDDRDHKHDKRRITVGRFVIIGIFYVILVAGIIFSIVWIFMGIILLYGVIKKNLECLLKWIIFTFASMSVSVISFIIVCAAFPQPQHVLVKIVDLVQAPVGIWAVGKLRGDFETKDRRDILESQKPSEIFMTDDV